MFKRLSIAALALFGFAGVAIASGAFFGYPLMGGASYCASTVNAACVQTIPAGPTATTGNETIPADQHLSGGRSPETVNMSMRSLNAAPITYNLCAAAACGTVTIGDNAGGVLLAYSTTIDSATVNLPASPMDGQRVSIAADHTVTSLTVAAGAGTTLSVTTPTVLTASTTVPQGYEYMYVLSTLKWYRIR